jgi:hypothetical protein
MVEVGINRVITMLRSELMIDHIAFSALNPFTAVTSLGVILFHDLNTTINIKDIF